MHTNIRKWGNSAGTIIPAPALAKAGLKLGDMVNVEASEGQIIIKQATPSYTLADLLKATPEKSIALNEEDREWLRDSPVGKELD